MEEKIEKYKKIKDQTEEIIAKIERLKLLDLDDNTSLKLSEELRKLEKIRYNAIMHLARSKTHVDIISKADIAKILGLSRERVRQIINATLTKLRRNDNLVDDLREYRDMLDHKEDYSINLDRKRSSASFGDNNN